MPKIVLITGGSSGLGEAMALQLAKDPQFKVYTTSRKKPSGTQVGKLHFIQLDLENEQSIHQAAQYFGRCEERLDVLINNAGIGFAGPLLHCELEHLQKVFQTNVFGILEVCRAFYPFLRKSGEAKIVNISSIAGRIALPFRGLYSASKYALEALSESLSQELNQFGIKVIIVEPGDFKTQISQNRESVSLPFDSPFLQQFEKTYALINQEVDQSLDPDILGKKVAHIITKKNPKLRYVISSPLQRVSLILKVILPGRLFERIINKHYKIPHL